MNPIEAAAMAWVRAAIGCPNCQGTGRIDRREYPYATGVRIDDRWFACVEPHSQIPLFGETIWADPAKCEKRCSIHNSIAAKFGGPCQYAAYRGRMLQADVCDELWQPRWDALTGDNDE